MDKDQKKLNETVERMRQLYEYSFYHGTTEADEQPQQDPNAEAGGMDQMVGVGDPNAAAADHSMAGGYPTAASDPSMGGDQNAAADPSMGGDQNAAADPSMSGGDPTAAAGGVDGAELAPNAGMDDGMGGDPAMDGGDTQPDPDDDVVDVTELTDAQDSLAQNQEELGGQIEDVNSKLSTLMQVVDKFTAALDANDEKLKDLQKELVKRNPTDEETMNVRLHAGGNPFDEKPEEFWEKFKDINNHYNITTNNDSPQYHITKSDIDNYNERLVSDEFDDIPESLKEYFVR